MKSNHPARQSQEETATKPTMEALMQDMTAYFAEYDRKMRSERIKAGLRRAKQRRAGQ